jgi:hypothetical protein
MLFVRNTQNKEIVRIFKIFSINEILKSEHKKPAKLVKGVKSRTCGKIKPLSYDTSLRGLGFP